MITMERGDLYMSDKGYVLKLGRDGRVSAVVRSNVSALSLGYWTDADPAAVPPAIAAFEAALPDAGTP